MWPSLIAGLRGAPTLAMPRYLFQGSDVQATSYTLHGFCDASKGNYAAVIYLVVEASSGPCVRFLASKTRVEPLRELTIPPLELLLLLAIPLYGVIQSDSRNLPLERPTCYTDSKVALYWIVGCNKE